MKNLIIFLSLPLLIFIVGCRKESGKPSWDTEILAPLVTAELKIDNIVKESVLQANADSSLKIVYQNDFYNFSLDSLFNIHDTTLHQSFNIPIPYTFSAGQQVIPLNTSETTYDLQGVKLRKTIIKSGYVNYTVKSMVHSITNFVYNIPSATLNGIPFTINVAVPAAVGNAPGIYSQTYNLAGYEFDLTGINHNKINTIYTSFVASVADTTHGGQSVLVVPIDSMVINNTFYNIIPYYAKGYFGENTFNIGPTLSDFNVFNRIVAGDIQLEDVSLNLKIENPIGIDARAYINNLTSINTRTGNTVNLSNAVINSPINLNRATDNNGTVYPTFVNYPLNISNSNIKQMIENLPDKLGYTMQLTTNPLGNVSGSNDFVYTDKLMKASLNMEIPLSLIAHNLTLRDTLNLNITTENGVQSVHSGTLTMYASNGFPFDASMQIYLLNDQSTVTDSIFQYVNTIDEAPLNSNLRCYTKKLTKLVIPLSAEKMSLLYKTKKIILKAKFNTGGQPNYVKIYSDYSIDVKLVADFNYTIQLH